MRSSDLERPAARVRALRAVAIAVFALLGLRAAQLTVWDGRGAERGRRQTGALVELPPGRGLVTDRTGAELAVTVQAPSVYAVPAEIRDPDATARALAGILGRSAKSLRAKLSSRSSFVFLRRWVPAATVKAVEALGRPGVGIVKEPSRAYPKGALAGPLIGFANIDGRGVRGMEQAQDAFLRGRSQRIALERDARGNLLALAGHDPRSAVGGDVALSIDAALQADVARALEEVVRATGARGGVVVVLDPTRGDLRAVAQRPSFDPNHFRETAYPETRSRAFLDAFEPGSAMKPFVVAAALERGAIRADQPIDCESGRWSIPGKTLRDHKPHGLLDPAAVLRFSSNIGAAKIGFALGAQAHAEALLAFGFGRAGGSGFPDESSGLLRPWQRWKPVDHATISFGQGISVTAVQMASALGVLASDGVYRSPRLVVSRREPGGAWRPTPLGPWRRVLRAEVARTLRQMLAGVVSEEGGTGRLASLDGVAVGGKTGTAQKLDPSTGSYSTSRYAAWFVGMAPIDHPELVTVVMIDEPRGVLHSGGTTAAPLFARVMASALAREGVVTHPRGELPRLARISERPARRPAAPERHPPALARRSPAPAAVGTPRRRGLPRLAVLGDRVFLPDLTDLTPEQVRRLLRDLPFQLETRGRGFAVEQQPPAGTVLAGGRVRVRFERTGEDG